MQDSFSLYRIVKIVFYGYTVGVILIQRNLFAVVPN